MKEILRKCTFCDIKRNKSIKVDDNNFIYYYGCYYHYDCFIEHKKNQSPDLSDEQVIKIANDLLIKSKEIKIVKESIERDRLVYWLYENYNISVLSNTFFQKLIKINEGTFSNRINTPISSDDLLQIFKKMKTYLDKVNNKNERNGKLIKPINRVDYDLAIVLNNYDEYIKWKQKQKSEIIEKQQLQNEMKAKNNIQSDNISIIQRNIVTKQNEENNEINIADLLDEVF